MLQQATLHTDGGRAPQFPGRALLMRDFVDEAKGTLREVRCKLDKLETERCNTALMNDVAREIHSLKGCAGFFDLPELLELCDAAGACLARIRRRPDARAADERREMVRVATGVMGSILQDLARERQPEAPARAFIQRLRTGQPRRQPVAKETS